MPKNVASVTIKVSPKFDAIARQGIADDIIEYIRKRTKEGKGKSGKSWSGEAAIYSEAYKKSKAFKQKADKSKVNLTLSSDMLEALSLIQSKKGQITIGYSLGSEEWGKAKGNIIGSYGKKTGNPAKARPFLEITKSEIQEAVYPLSV